MPQFFIHRPVFAWVIALFIVLAGVIAIPKLPISRYPSVAPVSVTLYATYPGATPQTLNDAVVSLIERELSGVKSLLYFESSVDASGSAQITATFKPGTDPELAQMDVQNRIKGVEPRLPQAVRQNGLQVESASSGFLMMVGMTSPDGRFDEIALNDYMARNIVQELRRIDGVGRVQLFGAEQAMRIWVDPGRLAAFGLTIGEVAQAIEQQNVQIAPGRIGDEPTLPGQRLTVPLTVEGQLTTPEAFAAIVLRAGADGAKLVLGDVARVELGAQSYAFANRENGVAATSAAIQLSPGANAVRTADAVRTRLAQLAPTLPAGMSYSIPFDSAPFVKVSIDKVIHTLLEAMVLVFLVMFLFLQNLRCTLIPAIVAPIALLGTFAVMLLAGFSINSLTMFGMVLAIGIIVDDAIVVVENVERLMATQGLSPREATSRAMKEITGAVIGITLVLTAVFIPMAFGSGSVGVIYQQFTLSMVVSILISAFLALTLTLTQELQYVLGSTPLQAGIFMIPIMAAAAVGGPVAGYFSNLCDLRTVASSSLALSAGALCYLAQADFHHPGFWVPAMLALLGLTLSIGLTASSIAIMGSVEADKGGAAGSLEATAYELGTGLGITCFGVFMSDVFSRAILLPATLTEQQRESAMRSIGDSYLVAQTLAEPQATALIEAAKAAFSATHSTLLMTSAGLTGCLAMLVFIMLGRHRTDN